MSEDLLKFVTSVSGDAYLKVEENLGDGYVRLKTSEAERRQAKHDIRSVEDIVIELLRNARDARASRIFVATGREGELRQLIVIDDGVGVPDTMQERVFEPRVTSKLETMVIDEWGVHGRGMALFSIRTNTAEARIAASGAHRGTSIRIVANAATLGERADQSTWPSLEKDENGDLRVARGPHNIVRRVVEFALEHPEIDVYLGSANEVLATLVTLARFEVDEADLMFTEDFSRLPVWQRPGAAGDAEELAEAADEIGLEISERSAHRILAGEIHPLRKVGAIAAKTRIAEPVAPDIYRDRRGLKIHPADMESFRRDLEAAFEALAARYYLHLRDEPRVIVGKDQISVKFPMDKED